MPRRLVAALALLVAAVLAPSASAAAPAWQVDDLRAGTAVLQVAPGAKAGLVAAVERAGLPGMRFRVLPMVSVRGTQAQLAALARRDDVVAAHMTQRIHFDLYQSAKLVYESVEQRQALYGAQLDGSGVNVAVLDGGIDGLHPDLQKRMVRNVKFVGTPVVSSPLAPPVAVTCPDAAPCTSDTTSGHGTHVAGIVAGDGSASDGFYTGIAPGAGLVGLGVGDGTSIDFALAGFDYLLAHPELNVAAVNNSWGVSQSGGRNRYDATNPVNVATKALHDAGIAVVFSAGNTGTGDRRGAQAGGSTCDTKVQGGKRVAGAGTCRFSIFGSAPWAIAVAAARKDEPGAAADQHLGYFSSRGDPVEQVSLDGQPVSYLPTVAAPGVNIRAARNPASATSAASCGSAEPPACTDSPKPESEALYMPVSGTSMAAPHVTGAIAVIQDAAQTHLSRRLTPDEVKQVLADSAAPMTGNDGFWDWPCGGVLFVACGIGGPDSSFDDTTATAYQPYQVGAGYLDVAAAVRLVQAMPA